MEIIEILGRYEEGEMVYRRRKGGESINPFEFPHEIDETEPGCFAGVVFVGDAGSCECGGRIYPGTHADQCVDCGAYC